METPLNDANPELASSAVQDVAVASSATPDVNADPSTAAGEQTPEQIDADILERVQANQEGGSTPPVDEAVKTADKPAAKEEPGAVKPVEKSKEQQKAEDDKLPFNKHPRWQEMQQKNTTLSQEVETLRATAKTWEENKQWLQENRIGEQEYPQILQSYAAARQSNVSHQDYVETMKWRAMVNADPIAALKYADEWLGKVREYAGQVLPKDLQEALTAGEITEAWAKRAAADRVASERAKGSLQSREQLDKQNQIKEVHGTVDMWFKNKTVQDPDFQSSTAEEDGLFSDVVRRFNDAEQKFMLTNKRSLTSAETLPMLDKAYTDAKKYAAKFVPKPRQIKPPLRNGSSVIPELPTNPTHAQLDENILAQVASRHGGGF